MRIRIGCKQVVDVVRHIGARLLRAIVTILENDIVMVNRKTGASNQIVWRLCVLKGNLASDWTISFVEKTILD